MWQDFKEFAFKGNVLDLAIAVIIGAAFGKIVSSLVDNVMMPIIGIMFNGINFEKLVFPYKDTEIAYGIFIQSVFDFFVIAIMIFLFLRLVIRKRKEEEEEEEEVEEINQQEVLLTEIRDLLKERK